MVSFSPVELWHVTTVANAMREAEVLEVEKSSGRSPYNALKRAVEVSEKSATILIDGKPVAIFGVAHLTPISDIGYPWMLGTDDVQKHARRLLPHAGGKLDILAARYKHLRNYVHAANTVSIRWLRRMGFTIHDPAPYGVSGDMFHLFEKDV